MDDFSDFISTMEEEAPYEEAVHCPVCARQVLPQKDQKSGHWLLTCCDKTAEGSTRARALMRYKRREKTLIPSNDESDH